jgi:hypothetical protein
LEEGVQLQLEGEFDRLARRAGGGDDDHAPTGVPRGAKGVKVERKLVIADRVHDGS